MNARLAKKIQKQVSPPEVNDKNRSYWDRYNRAWLYSQRLYRRLIRKKKKEGKIIVCPEEVIDKLVDEVLEEFKYLKG